MSFQLVASGGATISQVYCGGFLGKPREATQIPISVLTFPQGILLRFLHNYKAQAGLQVQIHHSQCFCLWNPYEV